MTRATEPAAGQLAPEDCAGLTLLGDLPPELLSRVLAQARIASFAAGETVLRRGVANEVLHVLLSGRLHVHLDLVEASRPVVLDPGALFGEVSMIDGKPVSAFVLADEASRVLQVPGALFWAEIATLPGVARGIMRGLGTMLRRTSEAAAAGLQERLRNEATARELAFAREIQMGMLRTSVPWFPQETRAAAAAVVEPALEVGGDLYDAFLLDPDRLFFVIGDVAGKGVSAALVMVRTLTQLRAVAAGRMPLRAVLAELNETLLAGSDTAMFVTLLAGILDLRSGVVDLLNFGHCPPVSAPPGGAPALCPLVPAPALGILPGAHPGESGLVMRPGETLLLYSDGVTEAMDPAGAAFGNDRLLAAVARPGGEPGALVHHVAGEVARFRAGAGQADDVTLLAVTWNGPPAG
jgi:sigma-B regulation protein RsbU (phosphoserine phosphatase)